MANTNSFLKSKMFVFFPLNRMFKNFWKYKNFLMKYNVYILNEYVGFTMHTNRILSSVNNVESQEIVFTKSVTE